MKYYNSKIIKATFEEALVSVTEALKKEGFGVLTEIDVQQTFKKKLDVDFKKYKILGACNPVYAHKAISLEDKIGVMLPCNVLVEENEEGAVEVSAVSPMASMMAVENSELGNIAIEIEEKLKNVIRSL